MSFATISTWKSAQAGMDKASVDLAAGDSAHNAVLKIIQSVENDPHYKSVGYGGLPNVQGVVQTDAAFMDGDTLQMGAVGSLEDIANPILVAEKLSHEKYNNFLVGTGAKEFALKHNFATKDMLSEYAKHTWEKRKQDVKEHNLSPYDGHDTIGCIALDARGSMCAGTSTSGLFMKESGRVGDSPVAGSGFYVDSDFGGAAATGLGEDLMKGVLSYEIVRRMQDGENPQEAADNTLWTFIDKLKSANQRAGSMSLITLDKNGQWGVSTNVEFSFAIAIDETPSKILIANDSGHCKTEFSSPTKEWLEKYDKQHQF